MKPLLEALAFWPGRHAVQRALVNDGFLLPSTYQGIVAAECDNDRDAANLTKYWDEIAREYFGAAGRVHGDYRRFAGDTSYRSEFLDSLASDPKFKELQGPGQGYCLDPCLDRFIRKFGQESDFRSAVQQELTRSKEAEIVRFGIDARDWTGKKQDIGNWLGEYATKLGYERKGKVWQKPLSSTLTIHHRVDPGVRLTWDFQLPLETEIAHIHDNKFTYHASWTDPLVPGFAYYRLYKNPEGAKLAILAHLKLFDAIGYVLRLN